MTITPCSLAPAAGWVARTLLCVGLVLAEPVNLIAAEAGNKDIAKQLGEAIGKGVADAIQQGERVSELATKATAANNKEQFAEALALAEQALRLDAGHEGALVEKGRALRGVGKMDEAIAHFEKSVARFPKSARLHNFLGGTYERAGQPAKAIAAQQHAAQLDPKNPTYLTNQVSAYVTLKDYKGAVVVCRAALAIDPKSATAHGNLGAVYLLMNRLEDGMAELEESLRLQPNNAKVKTALDAARNQQRVQREMVPAMMDEGPPPATAKPPAVTPPTVAQAPSSASSGAKVPPAAKSPVSVSPAPVASRDVAPPAKPSVAAPTKPVANAKTPVAEEARKKSAAAAPQVAEAKAKGAAPKAAPTPKPEPKALVTVAPPKLEPVPEIAPPPTGCFRLVKVEMPLKSVPSKIAGEGYEVVNGPPRGTSSFTSSTSTLVYVGELDKVREAGSETTVCTTHWSIPEVLIPGVPIQFRIGGGYSGRFPMWYGSVGIAGGPLNRVLGGFRINSELSRTNAPIPTNSSDAFELTLPESLNRWWLGVEADRNRVPGPMTTVRVREESLSRILFFDRPGGDWVSGDDPRTPNQVSFEEVKIPLGDWSEDRGDAGAAPRDILISVAKHHEAIAVYTYRWDGPPPPATALADRGPIEIRAEPIGRKELRADGREGAWIWARVKAEQGVAASRAATLTGAIAFAAAGAGQEWLDLGQPKTAGGWRQVFVRASNPTPTNPGNPPPATVSITASVQDGGKRYAKTLPLALAPDAKLDAQPDVVEFSAQSGQSAQVKIAIADAGAERWEFRTEFDKQDRALAKAAIKQLDGKSALLTLTEAGLEPRRTGGSDERATLKVIAEQKGRAPLERHLRLVVAQEGVFVDAQGRDPQTRQFRLVADGKGTPLEIDFRVFARDPKTKRIGNVTRDAGDLRDVKVECLEPKESAAGRLLESARLTRELAGIRSSNTPAGILRLALARELPSDGRVVPVDFRISYAGSGDAAFSALVTVGIATTGNGPGGKEWQVELARCQEVIDKFVPAAHAAKIQAMLDRRKRTLGADGLALLRRKIWNAAEQLTLGEGGQGYADEARWADRITECLEWSQWAGDLAFGAVVGSFVGPYGATATTMLKGVVISAINAYQEGQSAEAWLWENLYTMPGLLEGKAIDPDTFQRWGVQNKAKAWALYIGYHFLKNLWNGQSVIEALQNTGKTVGNDLLAAWLSGEVAKHGNRSVGGWAADKAQAAAGTLKAAGQTAATGVASGVALAQRSATPENPLDRPRSTAPGGAEPEAVARVRSRTGTGPDDRPYAHTEDVLTVMRDPSMVRALKNAPSEVQDAFTNTRELIYWQHDIEVVQHVKATRPELKGRVVRVMEFRTPGASERSINTDRDYRVCFLAGKDPKTGDEQWIEVPREHWEDKSYECFARVTGGPTDSPSAAREWAERHQQLATDRGHAEASADFSDQKRVFNKETRKFETVQRASNFERIVKQGEDVDLGDPQSLGRMYQVKVADARFPHEAFVQANKAVGALRDLRFRYENRGRNVGQVPERMRVGMEIVEKVVARLKADPNCRDPEAIAEGEKQLRAQGFPNLGDFMNKLGSQIESFKFM